MEVLYTIMHMIGCDAEEVSFYELTLLIFRLKSKVTKSKHRIRFNLIFYVIDRQIFCLLIGFVFSRYINLDNHKPYLMIMLFSILCAKYKNNINYKVDTKNIYCVARNRPSDWSRHSYHLPLTHSQVSSQKVSARSGFSILFSVLFLSGPNFF